MELLPLLQALGINITAGAILEIIKSWANDEINDEELKKQLENQILIEGATIKAEDVINALAENGFITISDSHLHAEKCILLGSIDGIAILGSDSKLTTKATSVETSGNGQVQTQGNAHVQQTEGSISIVAGPGGSAVISSGSGGSVSITAGKKTNITTINRTNKA
ncbi:hypothetical protein [Neptunicella sp. SCSIO 80796]|uniref:hypothetical protein n=1 Tax=Neptunicella plasticusilytica TaxID=3117012 RepID=UPI003A4DE159